MIEVLRQQIQLSFFLEMQKINKTFFIFQKYLITISNAITYFTDRIVIDNYF